MSDENTVETVEEEVESTELSIEDEVRQAYEEITGVSEEVDEPIDDTQETESASGSDETSSNVPEAAQSSEPRRGRGRPKKEAQETSDSIEPPSDWDAEGKEVFRTLHPEAQKQTKRIADEYQRWRRQTASEQSKVIKEYETKSQELEPALRVVRTFLPRWAADGITPEAALSKLAAFNELAIKDPDTALEQLAAATGRQIEIKNRQTYQQPQNNLTPRHVDVNAEVERVINQRMLEAKAQSLAQTIDEAHNSLKNEVNEHGKYVYPDFHDPHFESDLVPLVERILGSNPDLSPKDAIKRAYIASEGRVIPRQSAMTARPTGTNRNQLAAARRAATSVSGSFGGNSAQIPDAKPGESVEETVARTYGYLFNR